MLYYIIGPIGIMKQLENLDLEIERDLMIGRVSVEEPGTPSRRAMIALDVSDEELNIIKDTLPDANSLEFNKRKPTDWQPPNIL